MTSAQKTTIQQMRRHGLPYSAIATALGLSPNTIKSFCRRSDICAVGAPHENNPNICKQCGDPLEHYPGKKKKRFCNDKCRSDWWNANRSWAIGISHMARLS